MQPYLFPYIGYFQLINAADKFIFYDDVDFIKKGWINRNRFLINGRPTFFTVPLSKVSQNIKTKNTKIKKEEFIKWRSKFYKSLEYNYNNTPFYPEVLPIIKNVLENDTASISELAKLSIQNVLNYLNIETCIVWSSSVYGNSHLRREERILNICIAEKTHIYYNLIGGLSIYDKENFSAKNVNLQFLKTVPKKYNQSTKEFIPSLSIIDVLMNNSKEDVMEMLENYELV